MAHIITFIHKYYYVTSSMYATAMKSFSQKMPLHCIIQNNEIVFVLQTVMHSKDVLKGNQDFVYLCTSLPLNQQTF